MTTRVHSFPPMVSGSPTILILGSMPGEASIAMNQYYGNPRNHMWRVLYGLFEREPDEAYEDRLSFAASHGIAMWDVIASCEREGSLDANIRAEVPNDLPGLVKEHPTIRCLVFNGTKSNDTFKKYFRDDKTFEGLTLMKLPSTSPIPTKTMRGTADRIEAWKAILPFLT
ncbi:G/U mismatch-specific uracil-DNA glycosylase [Paenibacillus taihuensis]|uniref:G/U mismatch-specific uracil-DNA glycosylase n=1 Tax=Paenibacillus taihuensis TaxID=1156355 RepID=A0A3D9Q3K0_9BACL|nr:DNA-deoxyinosine glycosylase [Paenibacillus taihuensis]REE57409.1 G/U mismatch-specific uracil-DNA glycosylase [Paenibacillus taihuensis]